MKTKITKLLNNNKFETFIMSLIILNLLVFVLDSISAFHILFSRYITIFEFISVLIFTVEYIARVVSLNRLADIFKPMMLIDFFAVFPYYFSFWTVNTVFLRIFRLSRLFRIFKLGRYSQAVDNIVKGIKSKKDELIITIVIFAVGILISSILMYLAECDAQPKVFSSIPKCFYFSIITVTSVGYGDIHPITHLGKLICSITAILGVGLHGLFIGVMGAAFMTIFKDKNS